MRNDSYNSTSKANDPLKKNNSTRMKAHRTNIEEPRHFQKWMKKVEQPNMSEFDGHDRGAEEVCPMASLV